MSTEPQHTTPGEFAGLPQRGFILDSQLAPLLNVSTETLRDWIKRYTLPARQVGNTILIDLQTFYASLPPVQHGEASTPKPRKAVKK